jgi:hypothetical protein
MKTTIITLVTALAFLFAISSCNGQSGAVKDQAGVYKQYDEMKKKVTYPTSDAGWTMTCIMDGKPWKASGIFFPPNSGRIIGQYLDSQIGLPDMGVYVVGHKTNFGHHAVDFAPVAATTLWDSHTGEMEITRSGDGWVEGKFHFVADMMNSTKTMTVTDGFFRISNKKQ